jgi:hypothetical protein
MEQTTKKEALIKIRNEQVELLCRNQIDSKMLFREMIGVSSKALEEIRGNRAKTEELIKKREKVIDIIDDMLKEEEKK